MPRRKTAPMMMRQGIDKERLMQGRKIGAKGDPDRILITVTVPGSAGTIRFVVREKEIVERVIGTVLKSYAREGRLPVLGTDFNEFLLYRAYDGSEALCPWEPIGRNGSRNFLLCKKQGLSTDREERSEGTSASGEKKRKNNNKGKSRWKSWLNKSISFRVSLGIDQFV